MHIPTTGRLLDKVCYCLRKPCKATDIIDEPITVRDTFPYNPDSKSASETAYRWAEDTYHMRSGSCYVPEVIERDNAPFTVTIVDLHARGNGGRAYKVVDSEMRRFDLREDQVMQVMRTAGIMPGGVVPGTFVWGISGSQLRLVLVGGDLHRAMLQGAEAKKNADAADSAGLSPNASTLVVGHVYRKRDGSLHVYLGRATAPGLDKPHFAFMAMPSREMPVDIEAFNQNCVDKRYIERSKKRNVFMEAWDTLTWRERCLDAWIDCYRSIDKLVDDGTGHVGAPPIIFMASVPKLEADVGSVEQDFLDDIVVNKKGWHCYQTAVSKIDPRNYTRVTLLDMWAKKTGLLSEHDYWSTDDAPKLRNARKLFNTHVKWL